MKKVALSTDNKNKVNEMLAILSKYDFEIVTKSELGVNEEFEEIYDTLEENSKLKAEKLREYCSFAVLADDTGLFVNALNGEPGVLSARYAGEHGNSEANREKLLRNLEGKSDRSAYFKTVIVFVDENGKEFIAKGILKGTISEVERGENGFGYDKIFIPENMKKTLAEISSEEKNKFSHRKRALEDLKNMPMINYSTNNKTKDILNNWWYQNFNSEPTNQIFSGYVDVAWQLVNRNLGYVCCFLSENFINDYGLCMTPMLNENGEQLIRETYFIYSKTQDKSNIFDDFLEYLKTRVIKK